MEIETSSSLEACFIRMICLDSMIFSQIMKEIHRKYIKFCDRGWGGGGNSVASSLTKGVKIMLKRKYLFVLLLSVWG